MENAVKALLIAAAVLIAVLIISLVMGVFNTGAEQVGNAGDLSEYEIQQFNDKFRKFEGTNVSASEVNAMIRTVYNHNNQQEDNSTKVVIADDTAANKADLDPTAASYDATKSPATVPTGAKYQVKAFYKNNMIKTIVIEDPGQTIATPTISH